MSQYAYNNPTTSKPRSESEEYQMQSQEDLLSDHQGRLHVRHQQSINPDRSFKLPSSGRELHLPDEILIGLPPREKNKTKHPLILPATLNTPNPRVTAAKAVFNQG